jgi:hypothetical protein
MGTVTNRGDIPLGLAVWLLHDEYDYIDNPNYVSVTGLMKPIKHIILPPRVPPAQRESDVEDYVSRALGHSLHDSIEKAWLRGYARSLRLLGHPKSVIDRVLINPSHQLLMSTPDPIPVYLEQRSFRKIVVNGEEFVVGGKFDMVADGFLHDNKSTTAYTWLYGTRDEEHQLQGSLYRWLDADGYSDIECTDPIIKPRIEEDSIRINYIFTDWQKMAARQNPNYPQKRIMHKDIPLLSLEDTERWLRMKLAQFQKYRNAPEDQLPECTDEELWRSEPTYKYYSDPNNTSGKSTKNFDDMVEARKWQMDKGKGIVIAVPGEVKRCGYCAAFPICKQKDRYFQ